VREDRPRREVCKYRRLVARFKLGIKPWESWDPKIGRSPDWWKAYDNVKHERDKNFSDANQENTLRGLCGLLALHLYLHKDEPHLQPYAELLDHGFPAHLVTGGGKQLPGVCPPINWLTR
jgi:hypothetical protein